MIYFSDEDLLLKLTAYNLFGEALNVLGAKEADIRIVEGFANKVWNRHDWRKQYGNDVLKRTQNLVARLQPVAELIDDDELDRLNQIPKMDVGESALIATTKNVTAFRFVTGDKKCLTALHNAATCKDIAGRMRGNVVHLEQIILRIIEIKGIGQVRDKIRYAPRCDFLVEGAFGSDWNATTDTVCQSLKNSIRRLHTDCGGLLQLSNTEQPINFL